MKGYEMSNTTKFTVEGPMTLAYFASERYSKRVFLKPDGGSGDDCAVVGGQDCGESLEAKISEEIGFPTDAEFEEVFRKMDELRSQGLRTEDGVPDTTREVQLRITVEVL
jgi:hypothetical protein